MRVWIILVVLFISTMAVAQVSAPQPQRGDWLCWVTKTETGCGTYGWHPQKPVALKAALDLCSETCGSGCEMEYCEVAK